MSIDEPLMNDEPLDARYATSAAPSDAAPSRPSGVAAATRWRTSRLVNVSWNVVLVIPGQTAFTRILRGPNSFARPRVKLRMAPLEVAYGIAPGPPPSRAACDEKLMIVPPSAM